jgi:hypothetical protein
LQAREFQGWLRIGYLLARMALPLTVGSYIARRESAEDVFLTVIKDFVPGLPTQQLIWYRAVYKHKKSTGTRPDLFQHTVRITIKCL